MIHCKDCGCKVKNRTATRCWDCYVIFCKNYPQLHPWWKGGVRKRKDGYIAVYRPQHPNASNSGYVMQHRIIMESHIGRFLSKSEVVHHKNSIRDDNRIENLELLKNAREHALIHGNERSKNVGKCCKCDKAHYALGFCNRHWQEFRANTVLKGVCSKCGMKITLRKGHQGLCRSCRNIKRLEDRPPCKICGKPSHAKMLCDNHYAKHLRNLPRL